MRKPTNQNDKQSKSNKKLKHVNLSPIIFVKLVITAGKKDIKSKTRILKSLVDSGSSYYIITKARADKFPVKKTNNKRQCLIAAGVLTTNTKTGKSFSFTEPHANKLINQ